MSHDITTLRKLVNDHMPPEAGVHAHAILDRLLSLKDLADWIHSRRETDPAYNDHIKLGWETACDWIEDEVRRRMRR